MAQLVHDCPRCGATKTAFDVGAASWIGTSYGWAYRYEAFCRCRHCNKNTIFVLEDESSSMSGFLVKTDFLEGDKSLNGLVEVKSFINISDLDTVEPPEHVPDALAAVFSEGARCASIGCYNAAGTMFRLCVDLATKANLPPEEAPGLNAKIRRDLGLRLPWLFANGRLPAELQELSTCIKDDGNDGAHAGTLTKEDADDLLDFTQALLERLFTEPERLRLAAERRVARRSVSKG